MAAILALPINGASLDSSTPAGLAFANSIPYLAFDDAADEHAYFSFIMPSDFDNTASPTLKLRYSAASATSGNVVFAAEVMAVSENEAQGSESYDTANSATDAVPGTAGLVGYASITLTNRDSLAADDLARIRISRDANNGSDTATGDIYLHAASLEYTQA